MPKYIKLLLDSAGNLKLSDGGRTELGSIVNRKVSWEIANSNIESFQIQGKIPGTDPFTEHPYNGQGTKLDLKVRFAIGARDWDYSIIWIDKATHTQHPVDPKISVKPSALAFILPIALIVGLGLLSLQSFRRKRVRS